MKEKALIKDSMDVFDIDRIFLKSKVESECVLFDKFYQLSNQLEYSEQQLVIGQNNIREWKLKGIV